MGCCSSIPHTKRRYRDPADLDEIYVDENNEEIILPMREFGNYRAGLTNIVPGKSALVLFICMRLCVQYEDSAI